MKAECLASSSSGNCFILEFNVNGEPTRIMVECGISMTDIRTKLNAKGIMLSSIKACLITHAHSDHSVSAKKILESGIPVYASNPTIKILELKGGHSLAILKPNKIAPGIYVMPFEVEHDCEGSVGFIIKTESETVIFVNDHKRWSVNLINIKPDYVFIECNYDHVMVYAQYHELQKIKKTETLSQEEEKEVNIKLEQHERNINSHCSLAGTIRGLQKLNLDKCKSIFLMHLSDRYANEYKMKNEIQNRFLIRTYVCKKDSGIK